MIIVIARLSGRPTIDPVVATAATLADKSIPRNWFKCTRDSLGELIRHVRIIKVKL